MMRFTSIGWSLLGLATPIFFALFAIPILLDRIGIERFGILSLFWALLAYASVFDLGIGRAVTQKLSATLGSGNRDSEAALVHAATSTTLKISSAGAIILLALSISGVHNNIQATPQVLNEIGPALWIMSLILPIQALSATWRGINEALGNFKSISINRMLLGAANFGGPLIISAYSQSLFWMALSLLASRCAGLYLYRKAALKDFEFSAWKAIPKNEIRKIKLNLISFGGWATVSSIISPLMVYFDRFLIAFFISASAATAYAVPFEIVSQSLILVGAVTGVIFPTLSRLRAENPEMASKVLSSWTKIVGGGMTLVGLLLALAIPYLLPIWTKNQLPDDSIISGQILCIGVIANSFGAMFYASIHSAGKSKTTALIHILELPVYIISLAWLIPLLGIQGAAIAWSGRMILDAALLKYVSRNINA